ncbi:MAG TPA: GtrA family protein [Methylotenera sp.]|nr:GtrA family protein [Methylotenera sp.]
MTVARSGRSFRFLLNGLVATAVNYGVLVILIEYVGIRYTGFASLLSAIAGISISFIGNRVFVFRSKAPIVMELIRFKMVYVGTALFQALCMALWSDMLSLNYTLGFVTVTAISVFVSYFSNRSFVFK